MRFTMTVDMDHAAFEYPSAELGRLIGRVRTQVERGDEGGRVLDLNGNAVGSWSISEAV